MAEPAVRHGVVIVTDDLMERVNYDADGNRKASGETCW